MTLYILPLGSSNQSNKFVYTREIPWLIPTKLYVDQDWQIVSSTWVTQHQLVARDELAKLGYVSVHGMVVYIINHILYLCFVGSLHTSTIHCIIILVYRCIMHDTWLNQIRMGQHRPFHGNEGICPWKWEYTLTT